MVLALREAFIAEPLTFNSEHVSSPGLLQMPTVTLGRLHGLMYTVMWVL